MKNLLYGVLVGLLITSVPARAHDEGHGPKLTDSPKQGGVVAPVVEAKDAKLGPKAKLVYKAELVRSEDGTVRVYLYDEKMNVLPLTAFEKKASAILGVTKKKKYTKTSFDLVLEGDSFAGKMPSPSSKPFHIDVNLKEGSKVLLTAFDNLD